MSRTLVNGTDYYLYEGDATAVLQTFADASVQCVVTSPPYWGLRDYGVSGQLGLESSPDAYVAALVAVFREVKRVLKDDGTLWLNLGDSYAAGGHGGGGSFMEMRGGDGSLASGAWAHRKKKTGWRAAPTGFKAKDLVGIPWMVAFALRADGWYLRSDIIWAKPNPMPESVRDRPTRSHEYVFLLTKSARYYYDAAAIAEPANLTGKGNAKSFRGGGAYTGGQSFKNSTPVARETHGNRQPGKWDHTTTHAPTRNAHSVWTITPKPYAEAHFATFPPELARRCLLAGTRPGDIVLDPFAGSGTVGEVALAHGRIPALIELNPTYHPLIEQRLAKGATSVVA